MPDQRWADIPISRGTAAEALRKAAWPRDEDETQWTVHAFAGIFGCDHDLDEALRRVAESTECTWMTHLLRHDLCVVADGKIVFYDVPRPERSQPVVTVTVQIGDDVLYRDVVTVPNPAASVVELDDSGGWMWDPARKSDPAGARHQIATKAGWGLVLAARRLRQGA